MLTIETSMDVANSHGELTGQQSEIRKINVDFYLTSRRRKMFKVRFEYPLLC